MTHAACDPPTTCPPGNRLGRAAFFAAVTLALLMGVRAWWDHDAWWQLALGDAIWHARALPDTDPLGFADPPPTIRHNTWLYCVLLSRVVAWLGPDAAIILKAMLLGGAYILSASIGIAQRRAWILRAAVLSVGVIAGSQRFGLRPEFLSCVAIALILAITHRASHRSTRAIWALPVIVAFWTNVHMTFPIGPALIAAWCATILLSPSPPLRRSHAILAASLSLAACAVHPTGVHSLAIAWKHFGLIVGPDRAGLIAFAGMVALAIAGAGVALARSWSVRWLPVIAAWMGLAACLAVGIHTLSEPRSLERTIIAELQPPARLSLRYTAMPAFWLLAAAVVTVLLLRPRAIGLVRTCAAVGGLALALMAVRNVGLFVVLAMPALTAGLLALIPTDRKPLHRSPPDQAPPDQAPPDQAHSDHIRSSIGLRRVMHGARRFLAAVVLGYALWNSWSLVTNRFYAYAGDTNSFGLGIAPWHVPVRAASILADRLPGARVFCSPPVGSYLASRGLRPFIDTRMMHDALGRYVRALREPAAFDTLLRDLHTQHDVDVAIISLGEEHLWRSMLRQPGWMLAFAGADGLLFARLGTPAAEALWPSEPWPNQLRASIGTPRPVPAGLRGIIRRVENPWRFAAAAAFFEAMGQSDDADSQRILSDPAPTNTTTIPHPW